MESRTSAYTMAVECFCLGALMGLALGVLFAPSPGRETRDRVKRRLHRAAAAAMATGQGQDPLHTTPPADDLS